MSEIDPVYLERLVRAETKVEILERTVNELRDDVKHIRSILDGAQGGWKMLLAVGGVAGAIGGAIGWVVSHFKIFGGNP